MNNRFSVLALASAACVVGCASSNDVIMANVNPVSGAPVYRAPPAISVPQKSPLELRVETIRNATDEALQGLLAYRSVPGSVVSDVKVEQVNSATKITITSTPKGFFPTGQYALEKIQKTEDRSGTAYMDIVSDILKKTVDLAKSKAGGELDIAFKATYSAQADGLPARNLRYKGEYGDISLPSAITTVNGQPADIRIAVGQRIDNPQLAALRAVSLATFLRGKLKDFPIDDKFVLTTTDARGPEHRWVKIELTIVPAL